MRISDELINQIYAEDSNALFVRNHIMFRDPRNLKHLIIIFDVTHQQSGLKYQQILRVPNNIAIGLGRNLNLHAPLPAEDDTDF